MTTGVPIIKVKPTAWLAFGIFWVAAATVSWILNPELAAAILTGLGISLLHWVALFVHHAGHAYAARSTGYPMVGVLFWWALASSLYPREEPELPPAIHIRRALGGPLANLVFAALAGLLAWALRMQGTAAWVLAGFAALDSLFVFGLGALIPLGPTDGSTLLYWLRARSKDRAA